MKRLLDFTVAFFGLLILSPLLLLVLVLIFLYDFHQPLYRPIRVGKNRKDFRMLKFRSMVINADKIGGSSTSAKDPRITPIGHFIRSYKLDEFSQLWNVLIGDMSLVGPRPQVRDHVDNAYTQEELGLLKVRPGITDIASVVFSDEGQILAHSKDPDLDYNQLIRPGKGHLGLFYIENQSFMLDINLIFITLIAILNKSLAINKILKVLKKNNASELIIKIVRRSEELVPSPPPGAISIVKDSSGRIDE